MGRLDWMKRGRNSGNVPEPENEPMAARHETRKGKAIDIVSSSEWTSDGVGVCEWRRHVGKSAEGYHGGLEVSREGGEGSWTWSNRRVTLQGAENAALRMGERWNLEGGPEMERIANLQQECWESRARHEESPKEPGRSWER